jgi:hypothetical protein
VAVTRYQAYILGPVWRARAARHLARHPWCVAHGHPCRARTVHHASYWGWRHLGRELPWELLSLCHPAHARVSWWHQGRRCSNVYVFAVTWLVVGWARLRSRAVGLRL